MKLKKASLARAAVMILMAAMLPLGALAGMMGMRGSPEIPIVELTGPTRPLFVPPVLEADGQEGGARHFTLTAGQGETEFFPGVKTETLGYNGNYLGPTLRFREGEEVRVTIQNRLTWETTVHWHGMKVPWEVDGHPHNAIAAGEDREMTFTVRQEAATLWYHPHTLHVTGKQVYRGLAGFLLIEDGSELSASLPKEYGVDDVPVAVQDRFFTRDGRTDYQNAYNPQGTYGNVILANGTPNAEFTATTRLVRLRLLNGSNARTYDFTLGDGRSFLQVGTDGGLLDAPFETDSVTLTPGERAEIVVSLD
ncbi:MAG TPA: multicopper oxidase domain-containing protein, partial [Candidatus Limnocylindria bacterium]|nr:multicopper oxidase domain-containing protein [Candidatus Limnocylindria bacterium]